jgi:cation:H+ antiporter
MIYFYFAALIVSFALLFKCADFFVEGACGVARVKNVSKLFLGVVLVALATTAPEFGVSVQAAYLGHPEIALGNAIGSVICDDGIALALAAILAPAAILINCRLLKTTGLFLLSIDFIAYLLAKNGTIGRVEGFVFILILSIYFFYIIRGQKSGAGRADQSKECLSEGRKSRLRTEMVLLKKPLYLFAGGIVGVIISSRLVIWASIRIAQYFSLSETIIGLTIVAIGTSLPEISTCVTAAFKREGEIAVGNIIGADILNVLWIIGISAAVNPITVDLDVINFSFPFMILMVTVMLGSMRIGCRLGRGKGFLLLGLYLFYFLLTIRLFV